MTPINERKTKRNNISGEVEISDCHGSERRRRRVFDAKALAYSDVGVLVVPGEIQHVIQSQHAWRDLGEIHSGVDVVLGRRARRR